MKKDWCRYEWKNKKRNPKGRNKKENEKYRKKKTKERKTYAYMSRKKEEIMTEIKKEIKKERKKERPVLICPERK